MTLSWRSNGVGLGWWSEPGLDIPRPLHSKACLVFFSFFPLTLPTSATHKLQQETIFRDSPWEPRAPVGWRSPYCFPRTSILSETASLHDSLLGEGNVAGIFSSSACYRSSHLLSDTHSDFQPQWWSGPQHVWLGFSLRAPQPFCVWPLYDGCFPSLQFYFLNHLWRGKRGFDFVL